ncbi:MAG: hypothetical protein ABH837_02765 [bacterium]
MISIFDIAQFIVGALLVSLTICGVGVVIIVLVLIKPWWLFLLGLLGVGMIWLGIRTLLRL